MSTRSISKLKKGTLAPGRGLSPLCAGPWSGRSCARLCERCDHPVCVRAHTWGRGQPSASGAHTGSLDHQPRSVSLWLGLSICVTWISSGSNFSQVWPGRRSGTNPQWQHAPQSCLEKGASLGRPNNIRRNFVALSGYLSRIIIMEVEDLEVQPGRDFNRVKTPSASRTHWFRWQKMDFPLSLSSSSSRPSPSPLVCPFSSFSPSGV